ncbi:MAG: aminoglycoside phosphotransferase family protein [bacterium]
MTTPNSPWDAAPFPEVTAAQAEEICRRHGLGRLHLERIPPSGVVNAIFALGPGLILRVAKDIPEAIRGTTSESIAAPAARRAGVRTPRLIAFDNSRELLSTPYTIYERVDGIDLTRIDVPPHELAQIWRQVGRELSRLHHGAVDVEDPQHLLRDTARPDPESVLEAADFLSEDHKRWFRSCFDRLRPAVENASSFRRLTHGDAQPSNVLVRNHEFVALIDWGGAGWCDGTIDFYSMPARVLPYAVEGYREEAPFDDDETAEARILFDHLGAAISMWDGESWRAQSNTRRLIELLALYATDLPATWRRWIE